MSAPGRALQMNFRLPVTGLSVTTFAPPTFAGHDWGRFRHLSAQAKAKPVDAAPWLRPTLDALAGTLVAHGWRGRQPPWQEPPLDPSPAATSAERLILWRDWLRQVQSAHRMRSGPVWFGDTHPSHALQYAPPPELSAAVLADLDALAARADLDDASFLILAHYLWLEMHPLVDGNGRSMRRLFLQLGGRAFGSRLRAGWMARRASVAGSGIGDCFDGFRQADYDKVAAWWRQTFDQAVEREQSAIDFLCAEQRRFQANLAEEGVWLWLLRPVARSPEGFRQTFKLGARAASSWLDRLCAAGFLYRDESQVLHSQPLAAAMRLLTVGLRTEPALRARDEAMPIAAEAAPTGIWRVQ